MPISEGIHAGELSLNLGNKNALKINSTGFIATSIQKPRLAMTADFVFYSVISTSKIIRIVCE